MDDYYSKLEMCVCDLIVLCLFLLINFNFFSSFIIPDRRSVQLNVNISNKDIYCRWWVLFS